MFGFFEGKKRAVSFTEKDKKEVKDNVYHSDYPNLKKEYPDSPKSKFHTDIDADKTIPMPSQGSIETQGMGRSAEMDPNTEYDGLTNKDRTRLSGPDNSWKEHRDDQYKEAA